MMAARANSLQRVLLDAFLFTAAMTVASAALTAFAQDNASTVERVVADVPDRRLTDDHIDSQLNTDDNMPSGNPEESARAKREAMMLGMKLYEVRVGNIRVEDVAATSPAWDAGIRRGDRLISIDSLKPRSLAPWVEDIGRIIKDAPEGHAIATRVERDGEMLALRVRIPTSNAAEVRDARKEQQDIENMATAGEQQMLGQQGAGMPVGSDQTGVAGYQDGYGGSGGWGLGGFFDDGANSGGTSEDRMANSAVAQLVAVNTFGGGSGNPNQQGGQQTQARQQPQGSQQMQGAQSSGGQVGVAGFQNNGQGVKAVVVVRGLPQGAYRVGIGQGDGMTGGMGNNAVGSGVMDDGSFNGTNDGRTNNFNNGVRQRRRDRNTNSRASGSIRVDGTGGFDAAGDLNGINRRDGGQQLRPDGGVRPGVEQPGRGNSSPPMVPQQPGMGSAPIPTGGTPAAGGAAGSGGTGGSGAASGGASGASGASLADPSGAAFLGQQLDTGGDIANSSPIAPDPGAMPVDQYGNQQNGNQQDRNQQTGTSQQNDAQQTRNEAGTRDSGLNPGEPPQVGNNFSSGDRNNLGAPGGMSPFVSEIGILRVGPDGSGRVENQLEGMQVQNLAGMSVTVVSAMSQGGGGYSETTANDARMAGAGQGAANQTGRFPQNNQSPQKNAAGMQNGQGGMNPGSQGVVATGVIQLMDSGSSAPNMGETRRGLLQGEERPVDRATQEQRNRSQITDPRQDFNSSQSQ